MQTSIQEVRPPAHAGTLYPAERDFLAKVVDDFLANAKRSAEPQPPKAIIAPHGGYVFSGKVAANAYSGWRNTAVRRVVLIGPSHTYDFPGIALPDTSVFTTPLGELQVDPETAESLEQFRFVRRFEAAHHPELSLEVQLPFVQRLFGEPAIVPLITGRAESGQIVTLLNTLWGGSETVFLISSNLSHFHNHEAARKMNRQTARAIQDFRYSAIHLDQACGFRAIRGFLKAAVKREMRCLLTDLANSAEARPDEEVTGYGAFQFYEL